MSKSIAELEPCCRLFGDSRSSRSVNKFNVDGFGNCLDVKALLNRKVGVDDIVGGTTVDEGTEFEVVSLVESKVERNHDVVGRDGVEEVCLLSKGHVSSYAAEHLACVLAAQAFPKEEEGLGFFELGHLSTLWSFDPQYRQSPASLRF